MFIALHYCLTITPNLGPFIEQGEFWTTNEDSALLTPEQLEQFKTKINAYIDRRIELQKRKGLQQP